MTHPVKRMLRIGLPAVALSLAPVAFTAGDGFVERQACAQSGTCCPEEGSLCIIGTHFARNYYFKGEGRCQSPSQT